MPENSDFTPQYQDDALASFVDRLLMGEELDPVQEAMSDEELQAMEAMAVRFARASKPSAPPSAMSQRLKANLAAEFQSTIQPTAVVSDANDSWWGKVKEIGSQLKANDPRRFRARQRQQTFSFVLAGVTVIALVFAAFIVPMPGQGERTVASVLMENPALAIIAIVIGVAVAAGVWYFTRRKR